jgi:hypothetical protein
MWRNRPLYTSARVHALFNRMRADLVAQHERHLSEMVELRHELDVLRHELDHLRELRATVLARQDAEAELARLYRQRELARSNRLDLLERDPAQRLN